MRTKKCSRTRGSLNGFVCCISFISLLLGLFSLTACGRRGDPVAISPAVVTIMEEDAGKTEGTDEDRDIPVTESKELSLEEKISQSDIPSRLIAVYTGSSIVLTWDEVVGRDIKVYRVYRSEGNGYNVTGEAVTPAFTDKSIEKNKEYFYKITSVGIDESPASDEIKIKTEMH